MLCIYNTFTDPYFNLAAEEYLLKTFNENVFMLWQNEPAIIIGKHQDVWSEVNLRFVQDRQIKVARRFSGGGAVYHDPGNLNLTFIENSNQLSFDKFTGQIIHFLHTLGVDAASDERQALTVGGFKISGSAQCIHKNRTMHHATLLFSTDLDNLTIALQCSHGQLKTRPKGKRQIYVKSVKSPVTNISSHISRPLTMHEFKKNAMDFFARNSNDTNVYSFNDNDLTAIRHLRDERYATAGWNYNTYTL